MSVAADGDASLSVDELHLDNVEGTESTRPVERTNAVVAPLVSWFAHCALSPFYLKNPMKDQHCFTCLNLENVPWLRNHGEKHFLLR